jgi:hypothetical protein
VSNLLEEKAIFMLNNLRRLTRLSVVACISVMLTGCWISNPVNNPYVGNPAGEPFTTSMNNSSGKPLVWDCTVVQMSSPPRYACGDNKTYTAFQLRDFRLGTETPVASK